MGVVDAASVGASSLSPALAIRLVTNERASSGGTESGTECTVVVRALSATIVNLRTAYMARMQKRVRSIPSRALGLIPR